MAIRIVRLGSPRAKNEGVRVGTVRRPPRGVPKAEYTARDLYDVWFPELVPSETLLREGLVAVDATAWRRFVRRYRAEMKTPQARHSLDLLAALSHQTNLSVGCYCERAERCHRSVQPYDKPPVTTGRSGLPDRRTALLRISLDPAPIVMCWGVTPAAADSASSRSPPLTRLLKG